MKNVTYSSCASLGALALVLCASSHALGANGGAREVSTAPPFFVTTLTVPANTTATFVTTDLTPGSDTVIHIQKLETEDPNGGYIGGNDDCGALRSSCLTLPAQASARGMMVIVRAYAEDRGGSAKLTISFNGTPTLSYGFFNFGVHLEAIGSMAAGGHVFTNRRINQAVDTVLLALDPILYERAVASDDDDGAKNMSWLHLDVAMGTTVAVGTYNTSFSGPANKILGFQLLWDEDRHTADADGDGLGNSIEAAFGTSTSTADANADGIVDGLDTDLDGINDGVEVVGYDIDATNSIELSTWGAKPTVKDLFAEVDWKLCPACPLCQVG